MADSREESAGQVPKALNLDMGGGSRAQTYRVRNTPKLRLVSSTPRPVSEEG